MKIVRVITNIKSPDGQPRTTQIGGKTLLIGPNECGKSTVAEALQLALTGSVSGLFMRPKTVKTGAQLSALCPENEEVVFAEVELSDGSTARWEVSPGKRAKRTGYSGYVAPVSELKEALMGSPLTAYKFFFRNLAEALDKKELRDAFPKSNRMPSEEAFNAALPSAHDGSLTPDQVVEMLDKAGKLKREYRAKSKALTDVTRELQGAQDVPSEDIYETWKSLFRALKYEEFKRMYKEKADLRGLLATEVQALGDKEELIGIEKFGSAKIADKLTEMLATQSLYKVASETRQQKISSDDLSEEFDLLEKSLEAAMKNLVAPYLRGYINRVNDYLPDGDEFTINTSGIFQPALKRSNGLHIALSGSTEARVLGAMAAALTRPGVPSVVILDDRMWDPKTLYRTLAALDDCPAQVVIMSTQRPKGKQRAKWEYVQIGPDLEFQEDPIPVFLEVDEEIAKQETLNPMG